MTEKNIIVHKRMSDTELRAIINESMHLSPKRATSLLKNLEFKLREMPSDKTFEEYYEVFHTQETIFYSIGYGRPDPYFNLVLLNKKFIVYVYIGDNYIKLDISDNVRQPTMIEKEEIVSQLFDIFNNATVFWAILMIDENPTIEFTGE